MHEHVNRRGFLAAGALLGAGAPVEMAEALTPSPANAGPEYRLGFVTYNIAAGWDVPTILKICKSVGLSAVELRTTHKHGVEPDLPAARRAEVRKQFADAGIELWGLGTTCEFHAVDPKTVERNIETCKQFVQLAADLGAKGVKVRPNGLPKEIPAQRTLEQIGKALIPCGRAGADHQVEIWVEVHGSGTAEPRHMKTIMEHCSHASVGITWNSNMTDLIDGSVRPGFDLLRPWLKSCHINELWNAYPWRDLFACLRAAGYDRVTLAEIPGTPDAPSGERLLRYYKALWNELTR